MYEVEIEFPDKGFILQQIGTFDNPHDAFKEYISNSIDSRPRDGIVNINVYVNRDRGLLVVEDDGEGMNFDFLRSAPKKVGESAKKGIKDKIGRKAVGLFSYHTFGPPSGIELYTREAGSKGPFSYLRHTYRGGKANVDKIGPNDVRLGEFEHGTRVIINHIPFKMIDGFLTPDKLRKTLTEMYDPLLRKGFLNINIGYQKKRSNRVLPVEYKDVMVLEEAIDVKYRDPEKGIKDGKIEMRIFVNPDGTIDKVRVYDRGVRILQSITNLPEFNLQPWNSGKLQGYVNEDFLDPTLQRTGFNRGDENFDLFVEKVKGYEDFLSEEVKRLKRYKIDQKKLELQDFGKRYLYALEEIYKEIRKQLDFGFPPLVKGKKGDPKIKGIETQYEGTTRFGGKKTTSEYKGRKTIEPDEDGVKIPVRRGRPTLPKYNFSVVPFDLDEIHLRSKLESAFPTILINESHEDYKERSKKEDETELKKYISYLISKEATRDIFKKLIDEDFDPIEASNMISHIQDEFYLRGTKILGLE